LITGAPPGTQTPNPRIESPLANLVVGHETARSAASRPNDRPLDEFEQQSNHRSTQGSLSGTGRCQNLPTDAAQSHGQTTVRRSRARLSISTIGLSTCCFLVGDTGFAPVTSSVSKMSRVVHLATSVQSERVARCVHAVAFSTAADRACDARMTFAAYSSIVDRLACRDARLSYLDTTS
jgi:hypothetical protein